MTSVSTARYRGACRGEEEHDETSRYESLWEVDVLGIRGSSDGRCMHWRSVWLAILGHGPGFPRNIALQI
jgi:hypothetical protein